MEIYIYNNIRIVSNKLLRKIYEKRAKVYYVPERTSAHTSAHTNCFDINILLKFPDKISSTIYVDQNHFHFPYFDFKKTDLQLDNRIKLRTNRYVNSDMLWQPQLE